jgi:Protein of unknown function with HXXEE motif
MAFRRLAWVLPAAYVVHVAEEAPGFTRWAQRNASQRYSQRNFVRNNAFGFLTTTAATLAVTRIERRKLDLAYYTLVVTQQAAFNAVFHSATTMAFREYSPGLVTSILHLPLWRYLTRAEVAERRLTTRDVIACTSIAGAVHAIVVARQVFYVGVRERR